MLKSYASYFASCLLNNLDKKKREGIIRIVLFGSVAQGEATKESDVDIFIEVKKKTKKFEQEINKVVEKFYQSREAALFKAKGIENKINVKIGKLKEWKSLYRDVAATGIILYSPYEASELPTGIKQHVIIYWNRIGKNRGAFLNRVYGFKIKDKIYKGLLNKFSGKRLGKSCVMLPSDYKNEIIKLLKEYKVEAKIIEVFT